MSGLLARWRGFYGSSVRHLVGVLLSFALVAYVVLNLGVSALWNPESPGQSILVWFLGAVVLHDLVLFPLYALAERALRMLSGRMAGWARPPRVSPLNYIRTPVLAVGLLFAMFFPGVQERSESTADPEGRRD